MACWLFNDTHFLWLEALITLVNNLISNYLINPGIILHHVFFIKYLWISKTLLVSIASQSMEKTFTTPFNPIFFILLILKSFEILPKHNRCGLLCFASGNG